MLGTELLWGKVCHLLGSTLQAGLEVFHIKKKLSPVQEAETQKDSHKSQIRIRGLSAGGLENGSWENGGRVAGRAGDG